MGKTFKRLAMIDRRRSGGSNGLVLDLDARALTSLADGAAIAAWPDRSGRGTTAAQATSGSRPTFKLVSGVPLVRFSAAGVVMPVTFGAPIKTDEATTIVVAANVNAVTTEQIMLHLGPDDASAGAQLDYTVRMDNGQIVGAQNAANMVGFPVPTTPAVIAFAGSLSGAGLPEGRGSWTFLNGQRAFRTQDANTTAWTSITGITAAVLGGLNTGGGGSHFTGDLYRVLHYTRRLSDAEIASVTARLAAAYGITLVAAATRNLVFVCDSLTTGLLGQSSALAYTDRVVASLPTTTRSYNLGVGGQTLVQAAALGATQVDPLRDAAVAKNIVVAWGGTNDMTANPNTPATVYANFVSYCQARRAAGWKVVAVTCLPRGAVAQFETDRQAFNTSVRTNWATFADALADVGNDATIGAANAQNNVTNYQADKIHLTSVGYGIAAGLVETAVGTL